MASSRSATRQPPTWRNPFPSASYFAPNPILYKFTLKLPCRWCSSARHKTGRHIVQYYLTWTNANCLLNLNTSVCAKSFPQSLHIRKCDAVFPCEAFRLLSRNSAVHTNRRQGFDYWQRSFEMFCLLRRPERLCGPTNLPSMNATSHTVGLLLPYFLKAQSLALTSGVQGLNSVPTFLSPCYKL
jgi:hypothetical protein